MTKKHRNMARRPVQNGRRRAPARPSIPVPLAPLTLCALGGLSSGTAAPAKFPAALQGEWNSGYVSPIEYYDPSSGQYAEQSGTSEMLKLGANGEYQRVGIIVVTTYNCTSKLLLNQKGSVKLTDKTLTLVPRESYSKGYICNPGKIYESRQLKNAEFTWHLENSGDQAVLILGDPTGKARDSRYNRPR